MNTRLLLKIAGILILFSPEILHPTPYMKDAKEYDLYFAKLLPVGTPKCDIEAFLKKEKLEYSFNSKDMTIYSIVREKSGTSLAARNFQLKFVLDVDQNLKSLIVKCIYTGP